MKLFTIALSALALCGAALAAGGETLNARFDTPVIFGEKILPAGDVTFNVIHGSGSVLLMARAENGEAAVVVVKPLHSLEDPGRSTVVLGRAGNTLRIERIWFEGVGYSVADAQ